MCVIRPVTAPLLSTLPCIRPSSPTALSHAFSRPSFFCSVMYSSTSIASGVPASFSVVSDTLGLPVGVVSDHLTPREESRAATCCRAPGLNTSTLSFSCLPVFSDTRLWMMGGKVACSSASSSSIRLTVELYREKAPSSSNWKPLRSCFDVIQHTSCSSWMLRSLKPFAPS